MYVNLFVEDVKVGKEGIGRKALKIWADKTFRDQFTGTSHHIGNHIIEFTDPDNALGLLYSKMSTKQIMNGSLCKCCIGTHTKE